MTPNAQHKRAERERRKAAGYKRVECWITERQMKHLEWLMERQNCDMNEAIGIAIADSVIAESTHPAA